MKLQIINPPLHISNWAIQQGYSSTYLSPAYTASTSNTNSVYLMVNGQQIPLNNQSNQMVHNPSYEFHYDALIDYESLYQTVFDKVSVSISQIEAAFWPGEMVDWFEQCESRVFGQQHSQGNWQFAFVNYKDSLLFAKRIETPRSHGFLLAIPSNIPFDNFHEMVLKWMGENIQDKWFLSRTSGGFYVEVKDQTEAVKAKMILMEIHEADKTEI
jgi:hypothetical protein